MNNVKSFLFASAIMLMASVCLSATAQRKKVTPKPAATAASAARYGVLTLKSMSVETPAAEDATNIYFLNTFDGAVVALNKQTGAASLLIPAENGHMITAIGSDGNHLYFVAKNKGFCRYDGQSMATSPVLCPSAKVGEGVIAHLWEYKRIAFSPNKRYAVVIGDACTVFDLKDGQCVPVKHYVCSSIVDAFVKDDGTLIGVYFDKVVVIPNDGQVILNGAQFLDKVGGTSYSVEPDIKATTMHSDDLYIATGNQLKKSATDAIAWTPVFQLPSNGDRWRSVAIGNQYIFAETDASERAFCEWPGLDFSQTPKYAKLMDTKIPANSYCNEEIRSGEHRLHFDQQGNLLIYNYGKIYVYNPAGIKGYAALKGKTISFGQ